MIGNETILMAVNCSAIIAGAIAIGQMINKHGRLVERVERQGEDVDDSVDKASLQQNLETIYHTADMRFNTLNNEIRDIKITVGKLDDRMDKMLTSLVAIGTKLDERTR